MPLDPVYYPCCGYLGVGLVLLVLMQSGHPWDRLVSVVIGAILIWTGGTVNSSSDAGELYFTGFLIALGGAIYFFVDAIEQFGSTHRK